LAADLQPPDHPKIWNTFWAAIASMITDPNNSGKSSVMLLPVIFVVASFPGNA